MRRLLMLVLLCAAQAADAAKICPVEETVEGIDVSKWQGTIDWAQVKASGRVFAIARVSHAFYMDTYFDANWAAMKQVGLIRGVYQYFEPGEDPVAQAQIVLDKVGALEPGDLPPVLDVEETGDISPEEISASIGKWMETIQNAWGVVPIIYTGAYFWNTNVKTTAFADYPLWVANWGATCPSVPTAWTEIKLWQYSATGAVPGIKGDVDLDIFNGSLADLQKYTGMSGCDPHCEGSVMVGKDCSQSNCAVFGGTCVQDDLGLRCVSVLCPAKGGATVCVPGETNGLIGTCADGILTTGDCGGFGAICSTQAGPAAKCVSAFCAATPTEPLVAKDVCLPDGDRYACSAAGDITKTPCPPSYLCSMALPGGAACVSSACVASAADAPVAKDMCIAGARYHCDAVGVLTPTGASCDEPPLPPDAGGSADASPASEDVASSPDAGLPITRADAEGQADVGSPTVEAPRSGSGGCAATGGPSGLFGAALLFAVFGLLRRLRSLVRT